MQEQSWRNYQSSLNRRKGVNQSIRKVFWALLGLGFVLIGGLSTLKLLPEKKKISFNSSKRVETLATQVAGITGSLPELLGQKNSQTELTISEPIQTKIETLFKSYKVDWAAAAVVDAQTGAILALSSHSEKDPQFSNVAFNAMYPAASIFKVVTSAAVLDQKRLNPQSEVSFTGDVRYVAAKELARESGAQTMSLEKAFAKSANKVFGRVAAYQLSPKLLGDYAERFGFNETIPFDVPLTKSEYKLNSRETVDFARTGAGFGDVTLSPIHAALMAAAISNQGKMMQPRLIRSVYDDYGHPVYTSTPKLWKQVIPPDTAYKLKELMRATISEGTARRTFKPFYKNRHFPDMDMGGKTGSLTGTIIPAKHEWFIGYATHDNRQLAVGIVIINDKKWKVKPSFLAKEIFSTYFRNEESVAAGKIKKIPRDS